MLPTDVIWVCNDSADPHAIRLSMIHVSLLPSNLYMPFTLAQTSHTCFAKHNPRTASTLDVRIGMNAAEAEECS